MPTIPMTRRDGPMRKDQARVKRHLLYLILPTFVGGPLLLLALLTSGSDGPAGADRLAPTATAATASQPPRLTAPDLSTALPGARTQDEPADTALQPIPGLGPSDTALQPIPNLGDT